MNTKLNTVVGYIKKSQNKEYDSTLAISGFVGSGKSTFSIQLLKLYYGVKTIEQFKELISKFVIYDRKSLSEVIIGGRKECIIIDEAVNVLFKRDFMHGQQKGLLKTFDVCRDNNHLFTFNIPSFWALDSHTIQTRIRLWIHITNQKFAHIFKPLRNPFSVDVWNRASNEKSIAKGKSITKSPNYICTIPFDKLSSAEYKIYKAIKHERRINRDNSEMDKPNITKKTLIKWLKANTPKLKNTEIAYVLGTNKDYVCRALQELKTVKLPTE